METMMSEPLSIARSKQDICLLPQMANRHGLITGATGTGKTVTLQKIAECLSAIGVPVFMADVKGDLAGLSQAGELSPKLKARLESLKLEAPKFAGSPVTFWDVFGQQGSPVRATVAEMGPLLLSRVLELNDVQEGVLTLVFKVCDDNGLLLLDLKDLRAALQYIGDNAQQFTTSYGNISTASVGAIQRGLLALEQQGADKFFGEPALNVADLLQTVSGRGVINVLAADKLMQTPRIYATFLLWMLSELFEALPEVGDPDKPKLVFFFDEAHLLFTDAPKALLQKIEQVVRLIRSKGVGVYFVTQNPLDIPDTVLGQLGNRVQHALRAFTPRDQKAVQTAATTLRANPALDTQKVIMELGVGEALVSFLDEKGSPTMVERAWILPPASRIGPITAQERQQAIDASLVHGHYEQTVDRASAYEKLKAAAQTRMGSAPASAGGAAQTQAPAGTPAAAGGGVIGALSNILLGTTGPRGGHHEGMLEAAAKSAARSIGSQVVRGVLGSLLGGRKR
jgi:DNA helicase HerA-like ATPase